MGNTPPPGIQNDNLGFKVVEIKSRSPAEKCGLKCEVDFIISINGKRLFEMETDAIVALVKTYEDVPMKVIVYSIETNSLRAITVTPTRNWPGDGLLGVIIRFEPFDQQKIQQDLNISFDDIYGDKGDLEDKKTKSSPGPPTGKGISDTIGNIFNFTSPSTKSSGTKPETEADISFDSIYSPNPNEPQEFDYYQGAHVSPKGKGSNEFSMTSPTTTSPNPLARKPSMKQ